MKKLTNKWSLFLILGLVLTFNSCKKSTTTTGDDSVSAADHNTVSNGVSQIADDASISADGNITRSTQGNPWVGVCGGVATFDSSSQTITIVYNGNTVCNGVKRTGTVTVSLTNGPWRSARAVITVSTTGSGLVLTDVNGANYTLTGSFTITNESGGLITDLITNQSLVITRRHQTNPSLQLALPAGGTRTWTFDRTRSWSVSSVNSQTVLNAFLYTENTGNVESTGTDRYGQTFTDKIDDTIKVNSYACSGVSSWLPYAGMASHHIDNRTATITFGTDNAGHSVGTPGYCRTLGTPYGYYLTYVNTRTNVNATLFLPYW